VIWVVVVPIWLVAIKNAQTQGVMTGFRLMLRGHGKYEPIICWKTPGLKVAFELPSARMGSPLPEKAQTTQLTEACSRPSLLLQRQSVGINRKVHDDFTWVSLLGRTTPPGTGWQ